VGKQEVAKMGVNVERDDAGCTDVCRAIVHRQGSGIKQISPPPLSRVKSFLYVSSELSLFSPTIPIEVARQHIHTTPTEIIAFREKSIDKRYSRRKDTLRRGERSLGSVMESERR
jgi:hypothetical protein